MPQAKKRRVDGLKDTITQSLASEELWMDVLSRWTVSEMLDFSKWHQVFDDLIQQYAKACKSVIIDGKALDRFPIRTHKKLYANFAKGTKTLTLRGVQEQDAALLLGTQFKDIRNLTLEEVYVSDEQGHLFPNHLEALSLIRCSIHQRLKKQLETVMENKLLLKETSIRPTSILDLNDDCLIHIFSFIWNSDCISVAHVNHRCREVIGTYRISRMHILIERNARIYENFNHYADTLVLDEKLLTNYESVKLQSWEWIGQYGRSLEFYGLDEKVISEFLRYFRSLKVLRFTTCTLPNDISPKHIPEGIEEFSIKGESGGKGIRFIRSILAESNATLTKFSFVSKIPLTTEHLNLLRNVREARFKNCTESVITQFLKQNKVLETLDVHFPTCTINILKKFASRQKLKNLTLRSKSVQIPREADCHNKYVENLRIFLDTRIYNYKQIVNLSRTFGPQVKKLALAKVPPAAFPLISELFPNLEHLRCLYMDRYDVNCGVLTGFKSISTLETCSAIPIYEPGKILLLLRELPLLANVLIYSTIFILPYDRCLEIKQFLDETQRSLNLNRGKLKVDPKGSEYVRYLETRGVNPDYNLDYSDHDDSSDEYYSDEEYWGPEDYSDEEYWGPEDY